MFTKPGTDLQDKIIEVWGYVLLYVTDLLT